MKKKVLVSLLLATVLLASTVLVVYAGGTQTQCKISYTGGSITGFSSLQYIGATPFSISTSVDLRVVNVGPAASWGRSKTAKNARYVQAGNTIPQSPHSGESMYASCYYWLKLVNDNSLGVNWGANSNTVKIP